MWSLQVILIIFEKKWPNCQGTGISNIGMTACSCWHQQTYPQGVFQHLVVSKSAKKNYDWANWHVFFATEIPHHMSTVQIWVLICIAELRKSARWTLDIFSESYTFLFQQTQDMLTLWHANLSSVWILGEVSELLRKGSLAWQLQERTPSKECTHTILARDHWTAAD